MNIVRVMSRNVLTVRSSYSLRDVWKILVKNNVNAVPVVDDADTLVGIITKEDLLSRIYPDYSQYMTDFSTSADLEDLENRVEDMAGMKAKNIMSSRIIFCREDTQVMRALSRMIVHHVDQLPVVSNNNKLIGIVCKGDIFRMLFTVHLSQPIVH